jgi:hypothetical protein
MLAILGTSAARNGATIIKPILVSPRGLDPAYKAQRYNKILVAGVFQDLEDPVAFTRELLPQLEPGGRLVVVHSEAFVLHEDLASPNFTLNLAGLLQTEAPDHPVLTRLPPALRDRLAGLGRSRPDQDLTTQVGAFLEGLLQDQDLPDELLRHYSARFVNWKEQLQTTLEPHKIQTVEWLLLRHQSREPGTPLGDRELYALRNLNRSMLGHLFAGGGGNGEGLVQSGAALRRQLELAGLEFQEERLINSFFWLLVFRATGAAKEVQP